MNQRNLNSVWFCKGERDGKPSHPEIKNSSDKCSLCGASRPETSSDTSAYTPPKPKRDKFLLGALSILNLGSGYTTIVGATQIFPGFVGYASGGVIQLMLFLLLSGSAAKHAPVRKWSTVVLFSFISVYTSFFAYYDTLAGADRERTGFQKALIAHNDTVSDVYTPLEQRLNQLQGEIDTLRKREEDEKTGQGITSQAGNGPKTREIIAQRQKLEDDLGRLKPIVEQLQPKFNFETKGKTPEEILQADINALAKVPQKELPQEYKVSLDPQKSPLRSKYLDLDTSIKLLEPYLKVTRGEPAAIGAALIALIVDGTIIVLGTAIVKTKQGILVPLQLKKGNASEFLRKFQEAIHPTKYTIDFESLEKDYDAQEFRKLLDAMRDSRLGWVKTSPDGKEFFISPEAYTPLTQWLRDEQARHENQKLPLTEWLRKEKGKTLNQKPVKNVKFLLPTRE